MPTTEGPRTSRRARTAGRIVAFVALVFLMTGCIKLHMKLGINSDDTVSGTIEIGVQKELVDLTGQNVEDLLGRDAPLPNAPGVTVEPFGRIGSSTWYHPACSSRTRNTSGLPNSVGLASSVLGGRESCDGRS